MLGQGQKGKNGIQSFENGPLGLVLGDVQGLIFPLFCNKDQNFEI